MISILILGFLIGMRHALDADHLAAVATMAGERASVRRAALRGAVWGFGHTLTLFVVGGACLLLNTELSARWTLFADLAVGAMLMLLGLEVFWRIRRGSVHFHRHRHDDGTVHAHAHSHPHGDAGLGGHHHHQGHHHRHGFPRRALLVGLIHGAAGSAALLLLTLQSTGSLALGLGYIAVFGLGSILGMALLSSVLTIPLTASTPLFDRLQGSLHATVGSFSCLLGGWMLFRAFTGS